ncbi:hypothetical protein [Devosia alba]|uniref:hypothetical protein n=1 Tax=Devosia alba TaxID=3152360 RepID=UPI0032637003
MSKSPVGNKTLIGHSDIRTWVANRHGVPAIARVRNRFGEERAQLKLRFGRAGKSSPPSPVADETAGLSPCSWVAWLAELDRQQLALKVEPDADGFEFVERRDDN